VGEDFLGFAEGEGGAEEDVRASARTWGASTAPTGARAASGVGAGAPPQPADGIGRCWAGLAAGAAPVQTRCTIWRRDCVLGSMNETGSRKGERKRLRIEGYDYGRE